MLSCAYYGGAWHKFEDAGQVIPWSSHTSLYLHFGQVVPGLGQGIFGRHTLV